VRVRGLAKLSEVIEDMGASCTDDKVLAATKTALDGFAGWTKPDQIAAAYWGAFAPAGTALLTTVRPGAIDESARPQMKALLENLDGALKQPPTRIDAMVEVEKNFAFLKILWDRHKEEEFKELADKIKRNCDDDVFKCADDHAWKRVKCLGDAGNIRILLPESGSAEANAPIGIRATTDDTELDNTVLFKHRLRFKWTIEITPKARWWQGGSSRKVPPVRPTTDQPEVVQYSPTAGTISASVRICRRAEDTKSDQRELTIARSSDFRLLHGFETTEMLSFVITGIVAIMTGIVTFI
jgi:hypothetical protein